jgi:hypothetical protein
MDCPLNLGFKKNEFNLKNQYPETNDTPTQLSYTASNILAQNKKTTVRI